MIIPTREIENKFFIAGHKNIAGVDEVGRGSLAGPIVAAAVIFPYQGFLESPLIRDSKTLSNKQRLLALAIIKQSAINIGIGIISSQYIDEFGIVKANRLVIAKAIENLTVKPDFLLIDGNLKFAFTLPYRSIVKGDSLSVSIAAASIVAKVTRDALMVEADLKYPGYFFASNKGYGSKGHLVSLKKYGSSPIHRKTFIDHIVSI